MRRASCESPILIFCIPVTLLPQVREAVDKHYDDIAQLVFELFPIAQLYALEAVPEYMQHYMSSPVSVQEVLDEILKYSEAVAAAVPSLEMARKEFAWRNGFFLWRQPTSVHSELLEQAGCSDLIEATEGVQHEVRMQL